MSSVWQPVSLRDAMNRLMEESFVRPRYGRGVQAESDVPDLPLDVLSTEEALVIVANVPGLNVDEVDISIEGDILTIRGELKQMESENGSWVMQERYHGPFRRVLTLNVPIQADKAEARFKDGVLTLTLPKAEKVRPKVIKVKSE